ncbi:hypothetical protein OC25_14825 [Pedobacter kyungheensis]|uniref:Uncharacterized protein n=1 Tax=Pedobacter kyungheensis TaxID=1069985 RepID=A0A0C1FMG0_9SPHI|nr:hypothetical protein OC25_14825 [Pedobacter kyungheensis]
MIEFLTGKMIECCKLNSLNHYRVQYMLKDDFTLINNRYLNANNQHQVSNTNNQLSKFLLTELTN